MSSTEYAQPIAPSFGEQVNAFVAEHAASVRNFGAAIAVSGVVHALSKAIPAGIEWGNRLQVTLNNAWNSEQFQQAAEVHPISATLPGLAITGLGLIVAGIGLHKRSKTKEPRGWFN